MIENPKIYECTRRIDQFDIPSDRRIAIDNGIPDSELDPESFKEAISKNICPGTYSFNVKTLSGEFTKVAIEFRKIVS